MSKSKYQRSSNSALRKKALEKHGYKCHYCNEPLVNIRDIPGPRRLHVSNMFIFYLDEDGEFRYGLFATADHLRSRSEGGTHARSNIRPACVACNSSRLPGRKKRSASQAESLARRVVKRHNIAREIAIRRASDVTQANPMHQRF